MLEFNFLLICSYCRFFSSESLDENDDMADDTLYYSILTPFEEI